MRPLADLAITVMTTSKTIFAFVTPLRLSLSMNDPASGNRISLGSVPPSIVSLPSASLSGPYPPRLFIAFGFVTRARVSKSTVLVSHPGLSQHAPRLGPGTLHLSSQPFTHGVAVVLVEVLVVLVVVVVVVVVVVYTLNTLNVVAIPVPVELGSRVEFRVRLG